MEKEKVWVVFGYNGILHAYGVVGVAKSKAGAEQILKDNEDILDESMITEHEIKS